MPSSGRRAAKRRAAKKGEPEVDHTNTSAVFRLRAQSNNHAVIKYKGFVTDQQRLGDEIVELEEVLHPEADIVGKHAIPIDMVDDYDMVGRIYRSNIVGSYIVFQSNYPLMYLTVEYTRSIATGSLLQIYLSIKMDEELKKEIVESKNVQRYNNLTFSGKWNLTVECDPELRELWREKMEEKIREEFLQEFHADYEDNEEKQRMSTEEILEWINSKVETEMAWYADLMEETPFEFKTMNRARQYFIDLAQDKRFHKLLEVGMYCRVLNRRNEQNIEDDTYEVPDPEKVVKMDDVRQQMIEDDELIMSDSSESE
jgi:hypothetical protein